jgi:hypothetical protein
MTHRLATTVGAVVAALTITGSVASAAVGTGSNARAVASLSTAHADGKCSDVYGRWWADAARAATTSPTAASQADESDDETADPEDESGNHERPQNHGWYVSQAAHDKSTTGSDHGKAVSAVARGDDGKINSSDH